MIFFQFTAPAVFGKPFRPVSILVVMLLPLAGRPSFLLSTEARRVKTSSSALFSRVVVSFTLGLSEVLFLFLYCRSGAIRKATLGTWGISAKCEKHVQSMSNYLRVNTPATETFKQIYDPAHPSAKSTHTQVQPSCTSV